MTETVTTLKPRLGFAGVGWIGKNRMDAIRKSQKAEIAAAADPDPAAIEKLNGQLPGLRKYESFRDLLESDLEGIVIATPSALHAGQAIAALNSGKAVFCQKPLGTNAEETARVVEAARKNDLLLEVDFSYRHTEALEQVKKTIRSGRLGTIYGINLTFHNAYGPGKSWYRNPALSGGGCLIDLGIHLIDLLFWILDDPVISDVQCRLFSNGKPLTGERKRVEDYAAAQFTLNGTTAVQLSCSWNLSAGRDAEIEAAFYGDSGGAAFRNRGGSFYDFVAEEFSGTSTEVLSEPPDNWSGRAAVRWADRLAEDNSFNPSAEVYTEVTKTLDLLYRKSL